jgi:hypothetical protein
MKVDTGRLDTIRTKRLDNDSAPVNFLSDCPVAEHHSFERHFSIMLLCSANEELPVKLIEAIARLPI